MPPTRPVLDIGRLPTFGFGSASPMWWGTLGFIAMEGIGFVLAAGSYLYIAWLNDGFPLGAVPPDLGPGTGLTLLLLVSVIPNIWLDRVARKKNLRKVRLGLLLLSAVGLALCAIRIFEFPALNIRWDDNVYGSLLWLILGLHTAHLATDVVDTLVLTALMFTRHAHGKRFSDVSDNCAYWHFVVASWLPLYALVYGVPRL
jgi:heme/copper-type cytochrome/quinol oxidase subunit 3